MTDNGSIFPTGVVFNDSGGLVSSDVDGCGWKANYGHREIPEVDKMEN